MVCRYKDDNFWAILRLLQAFFLLWLIFNWHRPHTLLSLHAVYLRGIVNLFSRIRISSFHNRYIPSQPEPDLTLKLNKISALKWLWGKYRRNSHLNLYIQISSLVVQHNEYAVQKTYFHFLKDIFLLAKNPCILYNSDIRIKARIPNDFLIYFIFYFQEIRLHFLMSNQKL